MHNQEWAERMTRLNDHADRTVPGDDTYDPHNGETSDLNQHAGDLLAGPDYAADPARADAPVAVKP